MSPEQLDELERIARAARDEIAGDAEALASGKVFILDTDAEDAFHDHVTPELVLALLSLLREKVSGERGSSNASRAATRDHSLAAPDDQSLLPCPFCGGKATVDKWFWVDGSDRPDHYKASCVFGCASSASELTRANAIAAWNRRSPTPEHGGTEGWRPIADGLPEPDEWVWAVRGKIPFVAAWDEDDGWYTFNRYYETDKHIGRGKFEPTHWQPLPAAPGLPALLQGGGGPP